MKGIDKATGLPHIAPPCHATDDSPAIHVVLVQPEIPHNTGAIGRLCVGLGARLHLVKPLGFHLDERHVRRSGLDYWEHVDLHVHASWDSYIDTVRPRHIMVASTHGTATHYACPFVPGMHLVFGSETKGLPDDLYARYADNLYRIPMPGKHARSINLANAVAIVAYEAYRTLHYNRG